MQLRRKYWIPGTFIFMYYYSYRKIWRRSARGWLVIISYSVAVMFEVRPQNPSHEGSFTPVNLSRRIRSFSMIGNGKEISLVIATLQWIPVVPNQFGNARPAI